MLEVSASASILNITSQLHSSQYADQEQIKQTIWPDCVDTLLERCATIYCKCLLNFRLKPNSNLIQSSQDTVVVIITNKLSFLQTTICYLYVI